jgi:hypothetical protein
LALQRLPSQQGLPAPPHAVHAVPATLHASALTVQNFATLSPLPFTFPGQHATAFVPHGVTDPPVHEWAGEAPALRQVPLSPHAAPGATHTPPTQQSLAVVQLLPWQHGLFVVPHTVVLVPSSQM